MSARFVLMQHMLGAARARDKAATLAAGTRLLETAPADPQLLAAIGTLACASGALDQGTAWLLEAVVQAPAEPTIRRNAVRALIDGGALDRAETLCRGLPEDCASLRLAAEIDAARGEDGSAARRLERAVALAPADGAAWNNLANARARLGEARAAVAAAEQAARLEPGAQSLLTLARTLAGTGEHQRAAATLGEAAGLAPDDASIALELGRALNRSGLSEAALAALAKAAELAPADPEIQVAIGLTRAALGDFVGAEAAYRAAIARDTGFAPAWLNLGILLEQANRHSELDAAIEAAAVAGVAESELAFLRAQSARHAGRFEEALALAEAAGEEVDASLRAQLLGQLADRLGRHDEAFLAFAAMNRAVAADPAAASADGAAYRAGIAARTTALTAEAVARWRPFDLDLARPAPIFLVGFPRSGTTLLDTMLMGHPDLIVLEEAPVLQAVRDALGDPARLGDIDSAEANRLRSLYFETLDRLSPRARGRRVIDKLPLNLVRAELIHRLFPDARFILALRDPRDAVLSAWMQNFRISAAMASFLDLDESARLYDIAFRHWRRCAELLPLKAHAIRYEDLLADPEGELRKLADFLDLAWDESLLAHDRTAASRGLIRTPSYAQVTQPLYRRAQDRWRRYAEEMEEVLPILAPWAEHWGYGEAGLIPPAE